MTTSPGRIQQLAHDATPLQTRAIDVDARVGWLLAVNRLYHSDPRLASATDFLPELSIAGVDASRSVVSRWESGSLAAPLEAISSYEIALGLPRGQLTGTILMMRAGAGQFAGSAQGYPSDPEGDRTDALLGLALDGSATPQQWHELAARGRAAGLFLRETDWVRLTTALVSASALVTRRDGAALMRAAAAELGRLPRGERFIAAAVAERLRDPRAQAFSGALQLLETFDSPQASEVVVSTLENPRTELLNLQAVAFTTRLLDEQLLTQEQRARVGMEVLRRWRSGADVITTGLVELIAVLPDSLRSSLTDSAADGGALAYTVTHAEPPGDRQSQVEAVVSGARTRLRRSPRHGPDRLLPRLAREALLHRDYARRQLAMDVLYASPFRSPIVDELLDIVADRTVSDGMRAFAAHGAYELCGDEHRLRLLRQLAEPDEVAVGLVTLALGRLSPSQLSEMELRSRILHTRSVPSEAALHALATSGSSVIPRIAADPTAPEWQRTAAQWWSEQ